MSLFCKSFISTAVKKIKAYFADDSLSDGANPLGLNHQHILVTAKVANTPTDPEVVSKWLEELVQKVNMVILFGPHTTFCQTPGNVGVTGIVCIETSHASIHIWNESKQLKFDLYSCKEFDNDVVIQHLDETFGLEVCEYIMVDRNNGIKVTEKVHLSK